jgi:hypothetical protein
MCCEQIVLCVDTPYGVGVGLSERRVRPNNKASIVRLTRFELYFSKKGPVERVKCDVAWMLAESVLGLQEGVQGAGGR